MDPHQIFNYLSIGVNEILEGISEGIFMLNEMGKFVFVNRVIEERSGISLEQFRKLHYLEIIPQEYHQKAKDYFDAVLAGNTMPVQEFEYYISSGAMRAIELRARKIVTAGGIPLVFVIARNITERREAEKAYLNALHNKEALFNSISDGIIIFNMDGYITDINPAFESMTGIPKSEIVGRHGSEIASRILHPPDLDEVLLHFSHAVNGERIPGIRVKFVHQGKKEYPVFFTTSFLMEEQNKPRAIISIIKDISDLEHIEEALRQSEERYRSLAENIMIGLFISDQKTGKFLYVNKQLLAMFGYTFEEALEMSIWNVIHPDEHTIVKDRLEKRLIGKINPDSTHIYTGIRKDGSNFKIEISATPFAMNGQPIVQGVIRDITEIKSLQEQLLHSEKMKAIGTLAGGIAHDFNNLLMGIQGNVSLMLMDLPQESHLRTMAKDIQNLVQQGASLTRQLLGFARGGKYEVKTENINDIISNTAMIFGRTHKEIIVKMNLRDNLWPTEVDRGQIDQVLLNILVNAWQAMPAGGTITIESDNVVLSDSLAPADIPAGRYVKISISDTGIGMDEATKRRIFDPFFTTKEMARGVGLGLTSAYGIIKEHRGFIEVESTAGKGSTFSIFLPASEKNPVETIRLPEKTVSGSGQILIIDDEMAVLTITSKLLEKLGYTTKLATNGEEALRIVHASDSSIDCIILDMIMPGTNPKDLLREIQRVRKGVPVILASGYGLESEVREILAMGCAAFLQKPFNMEELSLAVKKAISASKK